MSGQTMQHIGRALRLTIFTLLSSALFVNTINAWAVRYPLIGFGLAALEVLYRTAVPVVTAESLTSADSAVLDLPEIRPGIVDSTLRTYPGTGVPMQAVEVEANADGTFPAVTISNPPAAGQAPGVQITPEG